MNRHRRALRLIAEARPAVLDDAPDRPVPSFPGRPDTGTADTQPARRTGRRLALAGLVSTVAAAVAGMAFVVAAPNRPDPPEGSPAPAGSAPTGEPASARTILLAAAAKTAANTVLATGDYWVTTVELHHDYDVGGYHVLGRSEVETWYALRPGADVTVVTRWLGAAPATDADKAAWRAAGSPTTWALTGPDGKQSAGRDLTAAPGARKVDTIPEVRSEIGGRPLTHAQIQALPTDPDRLKAYLIGLDEAAGYDGTWTPDQIARWHVEMLFTQSWTLLGQLPVPPAVRVATYRMLADLPGLTAEGSVRDGKGRAGAGIGYAYRNADGASVKTRLIIDPDSGSLLAREQASESWVLVDARFSTAPPPRS